MLEGWKDSETKGKGLIMERLLEGFMLLKTGLLFVLKLIFQPNSLLLFLRFKIPDFII